MAVELDVSCQCDCDQLISEVRKRIQIACVVTEAKYWGTRAKFQPKVLFKLKNVTARENLNADTVFAIRDFRVLRVNV